MQRVTITMSDEFADELTQFMTDKGYENRSEALRDLARMGLGQARTEISGDGQCVATLVYVFDHNVREIPKRLTRSFHAHHEISVATMHVHLDHDNCLELAVLRGDISKVRAFSNEIIAERGIRHGRVNFVPSDVVTADHNHEIGGDHAEKHVHIHPKI